MTRRQTERLSVCLWLIKMRLWIEPSWVDNTRRDVVLRSTRIRVRVESNQTCLANARRSGSTSASDSGELHQRWRVRLFAWNDHRVVLLTLPPDCPSQSDYAVRALQMYFVIEDIWGHTLYPSAVVQTKNKPNIMLNRSVLKLTGTRARLLI